MNSKAKQVSLWERIKKQNLLLLMTVPGLVLTFIFKYIGGSCVVDVILQSCMAVRCWFSALFPCCCFYLAYSKADLPFDYREK